MCGVVDIHRNLLKVDVFLGKIWLKSGLFLVMNSFCCCCYIESWSFLISIRMFSFFLTECLECLRFVSCFFVVDA